MQNRVLGVLWYGWACKKEQTLMLECTGYRREKTSFLTLWVEEG